ncbi:MAG: hypothetical protein GY865_07240, partial [candidate division Zixibacteria bacterium]|nr:hypothetical protein [candidate division Zixibacteria bacterium]
MSKSLLVCTLIIFQFFLAGLALGKQPAYMQVKVYYDTAEELTQLRLMNLDIVQTEKDYINIITFQDEFNDLTLSGVETEIIHDDLTKFYQSRLDKTREMGGYKTLSELSSITNQTVIDHPDIARRVDIGLTLEGRTMWAIKISDNPEVDEDEPEVLITGAIHAREVLTPEICMTTIEMLTNGYGTDLRMTELVDNREIWFIPVINVDGYYHNEVIAPEGGGMWRKNRRDNGDGSWGVDINRNFGYMWGYDEVGSSSDKSSELYRGTGPFSEPVTQNVRDFTIARNFDLSIHFHQAGNWFGPAWFYNNTTTPDESKFVRMASILSNISGFGFSHGTMNGCHEDWDYGEQTLKNKIHSIIIEVGTYDDGFWPELDRVPVLLDISVPMSLFVMSIAGRLEENFEAFPNQPTLSVDEIVESSGFPITWTTTEIPDNPVLTYELTEYLLLSGTTDSGELLQFYESDLFSENSDRFYSAPSSYFADHLNNEISYMETIIPYEVLPGDRLIFQTYYDIQQHYDYAYVEVSTDGENFSPIEGNLSTDYNPNGKNRGFGITGSSGDWVQGDYDLSAFIGQEIYYRFSYYADPSMSGEGFYIDDISPISVLSSMNIINNLPPIGTYNFVDHQPGSFVYKLRGSDIDGQFGAYSEYALTYVRPEFICGDVNEDDNVDILDIVFLINYKYKSGAAPEYSEAADVNSDTN